MKPRDIALIALFTALTAVGAFIKIPLPFTPVPITLQVLFAILAGLMLNKYHAFLSQLAYVLLGIIGLPVFAGGKSGLATILGPTGGFLVGFMVAAFVVGWLRELEYKWTVVQMVVYGLAGIAVIYVFGIMQLKIFMGISIYKAFLLGGAPFILLDIFKAFAAAIVAFAVSQTGVLELES
ncbi:MAG: biotin transporter BioY [Actinobacteria bacterium]|nr:MAG: biotin transporter BioY [Actinomycetota bacterium]